MEIKYILVSKKDFGIVFDLCKRNNYFVKNKMINKIFSYRCKSIHSDLIGVGMLVDNELAGFIGTLISSYQDKSICNLTTGIIDKKYRGKKLAKDFFKFVYSLYDVTIDISPIKPVYLMLNKYFQPIKSITDYQIWFKPNYKKNELSYSTNITDYECSSDLKITLFENSNFKIKSFQFEYNNEKCIVCYYSFRKIIKGIEIVFVSNKDFYARFYKMIHWVLFKKEKYLVLFVDHSFFPSLVFEGKVCKFDTNNIEYAKRIGKLIFEKYIKTPNRRLVKTRDNTVFNFPYGYLYSEIMFYES